MDLVAVHAAAAAGDDLGLDAFRFAPLAPLRPAALRQEVSLRAAPQVPVIILPERLRTGSVMTVKIPDPLERLRSTAASVSGFADRTIAHIDKRGVKDQPTFAELDRAVGTLGVVLGRYSVLVRGSQLAFYDKHHPGWAPLLRLYLRLRGESLG